MSRPKYNVLMLGWEFYPVFVGGMGVVTSEIVEGLTDANIGVHFVIPKLPKSIQVENVHITSAADFVPQESNPIKLRNLQKTYVDTVFTPYNTQYVKNDYDLSSTLKDITHMASDNVGPYCLSSSLYHSNIIKEIEFFEDKTAQIALESDFDLIHAHEWLTFKAAIRAKELTGKPVILHVHGTEVDRSGQFPNMTIFNIEKECLIQADYVIAVSNKNKTDIINHYGIDPKKIFVIHNSTNFSQNHQRNILSKEDKIVLFLGRITMQKGPEYYIQAAAKVLKYMPDVTFIMASDGDLFPRCVELVNDLGIQKNFIFTGYISGKPRDRLYSSADLFVMPSVSEPFGVVPLEAIKSGTPVIISKTSGVAEIIHNAIKVDFWDTDRLADSIYSALKYKSLHDELIERQQSDINSLNWNHQIDVMIKVYEMAMGKDKIY